MQKAHKATKAQIFDFHQSGAIKWEFDNFVSDQSVKNFVGAV